MKIRNVLFAAVLAASPLTGVLAQGTGGSDSQSDATSASQPGATGSTVVPGDKSTASGDQKGTADTKAGGVSGGK